MKKQMLPAKQNISGGAALFKEIRALILSARKTVVRNVDAIQVITNYEIGRRIVEYEQKGSLRAEYGKQLVAQLSSKLASEFGAGFSDRNLRNMRKFYLVYRDRLGPIWQMPSAKLVEHQKSPANPGKEVVPQAPKIMQTASAKLGGSLFRLSWSQYVFLMGIKDADGSITVPEALRPYMGMDVIK